jgi:hypothetical protein
VTQDQVIVLALKVVLLAGIVTVALWVAVYTYLANWRADPVGHTVVRFAILVAAALTPSTLSLFFQFNRATSRAAAWIDVVLFGWIAAEMLYRIPLWVRLRVNEDGERSYAGLLPFLAEVAWRRGRPVWMDRPEDGAADERDQEAQQ